MPQPSPDLLFFVSKSVFLRDAITVILLGLHSGQIVDDAHDLVITSPKLKIFGFEAKFFYPSFERLMVKVPQKGRSTRSMIY